MHLGGDDYLDWALKVSVLHKMMFGLPGRLHLGICGPTRPCKPPNHWNSCQPGSSCEVSTWQIEAASFAFVAWGPSRSSICVNKVFPPCLVTTALRRASMIPDLRRAPVCSRKVVRRAALAAHDQTPCCEARGQDNDCQGHNF